MAFDACSLLLALAALAAAPGSRGDPPPRYRVQELSTLAGVSVGQHEQAVAINAGGELVGTVVKDGRTLAAHWAKDGTLTLLYAGEPGTNSFAYDLSDDGMAVGYSVLAGEVSAFQWSASTGTLPLVLAPGAVPLAVNNAHTIAYTYRVGKTLISAVQDASQVTTQLPGAPMEVLVRDLSALGAVTGILGGNDPPSRAFRWTPTSGLKLLALPPGFDNAHGNALNDTGTVVGVSRSQDRDQATLWDASGTPALLPYLRPGDTQSVAFAVNSKGWAVGAEYATPAASDKGVAVLWVDGVAYDLTLLLGHGGVSPAVRIRVAFDVNDEGQIAARGLVDGVERALRLDPE